MGRKNKQTNDKPENNKGLPKTFPEKELKKYNLTVNKNQLQVKKTKHLNQKRASQLIISGCSVISVISEIVVRAAGAIKITSMESE